MAKTTQTEEKTSATSTDPLNALAQLQEAGLGSFMGIGAAWIEAMGDMNAELVSFIAERIKDDVKTQHQIFHCRNIAEIQQIQAQFIQRAMEQYRAETGQLVEMSSKAFAPKQKDS